MFRFRYLVLAACLLAGVPHIAAAACGDGVVQASEDCDDGNLASGDCCASDCTYEEAGSPCESPDFCFGAGVCDDGECVDADPVVCPDDGNPCTTESCDSEAGECISTGIDGCCTQDTECDDSVTCNGKERCMYNPYVGGNICVDGVPIVCNDYDSCTTDQCVPATGGCEYTPSPTAPGCLAIDADGDGVWDRMDDCPNTPGGLAPGADGCTSGDAAENPYPLIATSDAAFVMLQGRILADEALKKERKLVDKIRKSIEAGAWELGRARSCVAAKAFFKAEKTNEKLLRSLDKRRRMAFVLAVTPNLANGGKGDHRTEDFESAYFETAIAYVHSAAAPFIQSSQIASDTCRDATAQKLTGRVVGMSSSNGRIQLDNGRIVRTVGASIRGTLLAGSNVEVSGESHGIADFVAGTVISTTQPRLELMPYAIEQCYEVRIAPAQPEENFAGTPVTFPFDGYRFEGLGTTGTAYLERGMRVYVKQNCTPPGTTPGADGKYLRYFADISFETTAVLSNKKAYWTGFDLSAGESRKIGDTLSGKGTMTVRWQQRECDDDLAQPCGSESAASTRLIAVRTLPVSVGASGNYCLAEYDETEFSLPDRDPDFDDPESITFGGLFDDFEQASAVGTSGFITIMGGTREFGALAYKATSTTESSFPDLVAVGENEPFAIYPTRDPFLQRGFGEDVGIDHAAGVAFPNVSGVRNGKPYQYACRVPIVVRDVVDFCPDFPNSYYKLPYASDLGSIKTGQGNNSTFTHCGDGYPYKCSQKYAFDMSVPDGKKVVAARGGKVIWSRKDAKASCSSTSACTEEQFFCCVESSGGGICTDGSSAKLGNVCHGDSECDSSAGGDGKCSCVANNVAIEHQDGSVGVYVHFQEGMVDVREGDTVLRGDVLGRAGNTGCSTGPHLHIHTVGTAGKGDAWQKATKLMRFQIHGGPTCVTPVAGQFYKSNNDGWIGW